jgi:hypothetical protein
VMKKRGACNDGERKGSFKSWQFLVYVIACASKFVCALVAQSLHSIENSIWNRTLTWIWDRLVSNLEFVEVRKRRKMSSSDRTVKRTWKPHKWGFNFQLSTFKRKCIYHNSLGPVGLFGFINVFFKLIYFDILILFKCIDIKNKF